MPTPLLIYKADRVISAGCDSDMLTEEEISLKLRRSLVQFSPNKNSRINLGGESPSLSKTHNPIWSIRAAQRLADQTVVIQGSFQVLNVKLYNMWKKAILPEKLPRLLPALKKTVKNQKILDLEVVSIHFRTV